MNRAVIVLLLAVAFIIGYALYHFGFLTLITNALGNLQLPDFSNVIASMPEPLRPFITPQTTIAAAGVGLPLLWTYLKQRAARKAQEIKNEALQQVNSQVSLKNVNLNGELEQAQTQITTLKSQLADQSGISSLLQSKDTQIQDLKDEVQQHITEFNAMERTYQNMIEQMKLKTYPVVQ